LVVELEDPDICPQCGSANLEQDPDVLDTWFSSWLWPFSTLGWPDKTLEMDYFYPTDVLVSAYDIIFFWIARMIMAGLEFTGNIPYHTVYITGMIRDELGRWMSKSLGNGIDPIDMVDQYGADAVRYSLIALNTEGMDIKLAPSRFEMGRNFANKLWNAGRFLELQGGLKKLSLAPDELCDQWISSRFQKVIAEVNDKMTRYKLNEALSAIYNFTWHEYCDWYLELIKPRLYGKDASARETALTLALEVFHGVLKLLHPFMPFITEELQEAACGNISENELLITSSFPQPLASRFDESAEEEMDLIQSVIGAVRNLRSEMNVPPFKMAEIYLFGEGEKITVLEKHIGYLTSLGKIDRINRGHTKPRPAVSALVAGLEIFLPLGDLIDVPAELERLKKELERQEGKLAGIQKKLANEQFLVKASPQIVQNEKDKLKSAEEAIAKLKGNISLMLNTEL
jgi:valyl-tRNA synthetase